VELVEDLRDYAVKLPRYSRCASVLKKSSVAMIEIPEWRVFLNEGPGRGGGGPEAGGAKLVKVKFWASAGVPDAQF